MKKIVFSVLFTVAFAASAHCQWCGDSRYTDVQLDSIVTANRDSIARMTRADYIRIDDVKLERAVMRSLRPEQLTRFWVEKFDEVLTLDWSDVERAHIRKMRDYISENGPQLYSEKCPKEVREKSQAWIGEWGKYAVDELKWSPKLLSGMAWKIHRMTDKEGTLDLPYVSCELPDDKPV